MIDFITEHWITLLISFGVTCLFARLQWHYFTKNKRLISSLCSFFLSDPSLYKTVKQDDVCLIIPLGNGGHLSLNALIHEINLYVQKSIGTADFNIIQNKTERKVESLFEHATAELSFPTYYGLMGTFLGTFIGLVGFLASGSDLSDENKVTNLIVGVLVSMATSLFGLALTTRSNHIAALSKKQLDEQKNEFLDFIQLELIPQLQTTVTTLQQTMSDFVPKFDTVISNFERTFTGVIGRFKTTFDECTANFGTEFRANTSLISETVDTLNDSIGHITDNVENQRKLLEELRSEQMFETLQQFVDAAQTFRTSSSTIDTYNELLQSLMFTTQSVIDKQTEYAQSLHIPQDLVVRLNELLNRISSFEHNINAVGENIAQSEMLGNKELALIQRHLESLEEKKQLADRFLDTSNDELEAIFQEQNKVVKSLFSHYQQQLEEERDALNNFVRETLQIISKKKADLLSHLENAFDVSRVNAMFSHLKTLPEIVSLLEAIQQRIIRDEQLNHHVQQLLSHITLLQQTMNSTSSSLTETMNETSSSQIRVMGEERRALAAIIQGASELERTLYKTWNDGVQGAIADTLSGLKEVRETTETQVERLMQGINGVAATTRYLHRDVVRDISTNMSNETRRLHADIQDLGKQTETALRSSSEQTQRSIAHYSAEHKHNIAEIVEALQQQGQTITGFLDAIKEKEK